MKIIRLKLVVVVAVAMQVPNAVPSTFLFAICDPFPSLFLFWLFSEQIIAKEQVYVCPGGGPPRSLPPGILAEAVEAASNLDSALKQVGL